MPALHSWSGPPALGVGQSLTLGVLAESAEPAPPRSAGAPNGVSSSGRRRSSIDLKRKARAGAREYRRGLAQATARLSGLLKAMAAHSWAEGGSRAIHQNTCTATIVQVMISPASHREGTSN